MEESLWNLTFSPPFGVPSCWGSGSSLIFARREADMAEVYMLPNPRTSSTWAKEKFLIFLSWLRVKNTCPKWNPGKWKHGQKPAVPWWFSFDPYPVDQTRPKEPSAIEIFVFGSAFARTYAVERLVIWWVLGQQFPAENLLAR